MSRRSMPIKYIVIHCSDTPPSMDIGAAEIRKWHTDPKPQGNGWDDIGYHFVIRRNGEVEVGRAEHDMGAHVRGHNHHSIGICLVGGMSRPNRPNSAVSNFTRAQWNTLSSLLIGLEKKYKLAEVVGHTELDPTKTCPNVDVKGYMGR